MSSQVALVKCLSYESKEVESSLKKAVDLLGGITVFIRPQSRVLLKPNLLMAKEPEYAITTHPEVIRACIRLLKGIDCRVVVGDGPSVWGNQIENIDEVYERSGTKAVCAEEGAELVKFENRRWRGKFPLTTWLDQCDYLLNLAKFKTHGFTVLSGAIKNNFGLVPGTFKTELHKTYASPQDFAAMLVDVYQQAKPVLNIIDAVVSLEGDGPGTSGKPRKTNRLLVSADAIALDSILALMMSLRPEDILTTKEAAKRGLGSAEPSTIEILGDSLAVEEGFILPAASLLDRKLAQQVLKLIRGFIRYYPYLEPDKCITCAACVANCPHKAIRLKGKGIIFDYQKCVSCFCCQEVCPQAAIKLKKSLLAKLAGL
jgi:uncharacterized protein (DUF362 family)/NAD-dependent dihydropyrimidine dehydrogenase PreA subunit